MRRARELLLGSLPLLVPLPFGILPEVLSAPRDAESVRVSGEDTRDRRDPIHPALGVESTPASEVRRASIPAEPAAPEGDCWVVEHSIESIGGHPFKCTKWLCSDGRTWTDCVPI